MRKLLKSVMDAGKLLPFAFVLMLAFLVAMAWDGFSRTRELLNSQAYVEHTHQVLHEMEGIEDGLQDAREAWLHYILTPEKIDLETFEDAVAHTWKQVERVTVLTTDDPVQQARIKQLSEWITAELQQLRDNLRTEKTLLVYHSKDADFKRDRVREAILKFKDEEEQLLRERNQAATLRAREVERSVTERIIGFSALMAFLFLLVIRESKKLRVAQQTALHAQNRLEASLQQLQTETDNNKMLNEVQGSLQISARAGEAYEVIAGTLERLVPNSSGAVFAIDYGRDLMETMATWGQPRPSGHHFFSPGDCCAVRGGRLYLRPERSRGICCGHFSGDIPESYICMPLAALGETLGILHISADNAAVFNASRLALFQQVAEYASLRLANLKLKEKLQHQSIRDPLTGLYNRRFLETMLDQELRRAAQFHTGTGVIMADIDGFKQFNDRFGHDAGDAVLKEIAVLLRHSVRSEDIVCRYGGEEFIAVMPESTPESLYERAELMRSAINKLHLEHAGRPLGSVSASFGVSFCRDGSLSSDLLLRYADAALYQAKRNGCNCVSMSETVGHLLGTSDEIEEPEVIKKKASVS